jgi:ornithine decarboxylase
VLSPEGAWRRAEAVGRVVFGPTCDSVDRLPGDVAMPGDMEEGDYVLFHGIGAYSVATATRFNGFGDHGLETVYAFAA